jgi:F420-0:gamma-glutamyl ligase-like protein
LSAQKSCVVNIGRAGSNRYHVVSCRSRYWRPGSDYSTLIIRHISEHLSDGNFVVVSEKAVSIAKGRIVDESKVNSGLTANIISRFWMRWIWGYPLGRLCHMSKTTRSRLRRYPVKEGAAHKQLCLNYAGLLQALRHGSEGGIDVSNLPYAYAALPLSDPQTEAENLCDKIRCATGRNVSVMIVDTDKTYRLGRRNYTPLPRAVLGIASGGGLLIYVICRVLRCKRRATVLGYAGENLNLETLLDIAETANRARGVGAGRTPWHMAERFGVKLTGVTWAMLDQVAHYPVVVVKRLG